VRAASRCFADWLSERGGTGAAEIDQAISHLRETIERHGASRFQRMGEVTRDRLGFIREREGDTEYMFLPEIWKSLMAGRDARRIASKLAARGILKRDADGRPNRKERLDGLNGTHRVYVVSHAALFADGGGDA
jgi:putative DNA primase/helicase